LAWKKPREDLLLVLLSLFVQIPLALFLGHYYDQRVFMATGYLVGSGLNPYQHYEIVGVFAHTSFQEAIPRFGYPPLWAFVLGLAFQLSYQVVPNLLLYNFATKIPIIAANICLAFFARHVLIEWTGAEKNAQFAFLFFLFNPFTLLTTAAWGQLDTVATFLCVASFYLLNQGRKGWCALALALAFSIKPVVLPILGLPLFFQKTKTWQTNIAYIGILTIAIFAFLIMPFLIEGWQLFFSSDEWTAHFRTAGGLTLFGVVEIFNGTLLLPQSLEILGFLWVPALILGYYSIYRSPPASKTELIQKVIFLFLIFFLMRSWLSEPNINLILPLMLIALGTQKATFRNFHFAWAIPFVFMFLNYSIPQLFFILCPTVISDLAVLDTQILTMRLVGRLFVAGLWQILALMFLYRMFNRKYQQD
jgi:hypothetical protein